MSEVLHLLVFRVEERRCAVTLDVVERVVRAVAVTPLPNAPEVVHGVIDIGGRVLPVLKMRLRLGCPEKAIGAGDQFLIARTARRPVVLAIDAVEGVIGRLRASLVPAVEIVAGLAHLAGVVQLEEGLVLVQNLDQFLSLGEEQALDQALNAEVVKHGR